MLEKTVWVGLIVVVLLAAFAYRGFGGENDNFSVTIDEALRMWESKEAMMIDIRTPEEYQAGHIPGVLLIPLDQLANRASEVPKDQKVLLICRSGNRSSQGTKLLRSKGFDNVYNVMSGMSAWRGPVEK
ncbi:Thiosulfate sulfurtransferase GlpE [bioreactor metagenome]|uniref:Thiosulfate sulfurtransferase GlpE n=1 Tax=bioreactor metagenome TaxID=1076179 RepID=A0A644U829_9ZZZZ|nr:rhodanese-like domain-containing protein [Negativicutes bacterium]